MRRLKRIHLIDKFLLIFMTLFLLQSAYNLFINESQSQETNAIDVIVRTSAAAIFGYFISANFVRQDSIKEPTGEMRKGARVSSTAKRKGIMGRIGFALPEEEEEVEEAETGYGEVVEKEDESYAEVSAKLQIIITGSIGIAALCLLLVFRNFFEMTAASAGTVSQLRDFVSGCVGFLIGGTTSRKKQ